MRSTSQNSEEWEMKCTLSEGNQMTLVMDTVLPKDPLGHP